MSAKDKLKATVETLSEADAAAALEFIVREVEGALVGDEPVTPDEEVALAAAYAGRPVADGVKGGRGASGGARRRAPGAS